MSIFLVTADEESGGQATEDMNRTKGGDKREIDLKEYQNSASIFRVGYMFIIKSFPMETGVSREL